MEARHRLAVIRNAAQHGASGETLRDLQAADTKLAMQLQDGEDMQHLAGLVVVLNGGSVDEWSSNTDGTKEDYNQRPEDVDVAIDDLVEGEVVDIKCPKCKSKVVQITAQLRSADEARSVIRRCSSDACDWKSVS